MSTKHPILICFGTRPEWLKVKPLLEVMKKSEYRLFFTGQHQDLLNDVNVDFKVDIKESNSLNRLDAIMSSCLENFPVGEFSGVMVQGDTASAFACAISAYHRKIKIYYLEAGLRSYDLDNPYPEEGYRQVISRLANVNFAPTELSAQNLYNEKVEGKIYVVGNTVLDNLVKYGNGVYGNKILVTLHRRENHHWMKEWFESIDNLAKDYKNYEFILPIHPNPNVQKYKHLLKNVKVVNPLSHEEIIKVIKEATLIITDSGGLQEEGTFFNKKIIVCRKTTERPEGIKTGHLHLCETPEQIKDIFVQIEKNPYISTPCPYGDGNAVKNIYKILNDE